MPQPELAADCRHCSALCCVSLAFDQSEHFAFDKPAGVPCPHLTPTDRCRIHARLEERGFAGCARYDCLGAGQRVTHEVLPAEHWRQGPASAGRLFDAFRALRRVHEALELLATAAQLPLSRTQQETCARLTELLAPSTPWTEPSLADLEAYPLFTELRAFLVSLRRTAEPARPRRRLPLCGQ